MKGTIQKWKLVILLDALLFLSNMTFAKDTINQYTEGNPIDTTAVSISDKTNIPDRLYVDSLSLKRHFIHRIGIEARPGYIFPTSSFFRGENEKNSSSNRWLFIMWQKHHGKSTCKICWLYIR